MKKLSFTAVFAITLIIGCLATSVAYAFKSLSHIERQPSSTNLDIAILFHRMADHEPSFSKWAQTTEAFKKAPKSERKRIFNEQTDVVRDMYYSASVEDPIVVHISAQIPPYDTAREAFLIENFNNKLHFSFSHLKNNFAVIPIGITKFKWYTIPAEQLKNSGLNLKKPNIVNLQLTLTPKTADTTGAVMIDGKQHWLLSAEVDEVQMWSSRGHIMWVMDRPRPVNKDLLEIYKE